LVGKSSGADAGTENPTLGLQGVCKKTDKKSGCYALCAAAAGRSKAVFFIQS
jgi:hypothetical protein